MVRERFQEKIADRVPKRSNWLDRPSGPCLSNQSFVRVARYSARAAQRRAGTGIPWSLCWCEGDFATAVSPRRVRSGKTALNVMPNARHHTPPKAVAWIEC